MRRAWLPMLVLFVAAGVAKPVFGSQELRPCRLRIDSHSLAKETPAFAIGAVETRPASIFQINPHFGKAVLSTMTAFSSYFECVSFMCDPSYSTRIYNECIADGHTKPYCRDLARDAELDCDYTFCQYYFD